MDSITIHAEDRESTFTTSSVTIDGTEHHYGDITGIWQATDQNVYLLEFGEETAEVAFPPEKEQLVAGLISRIAAARHLDIHPFRLSDLQDAVAWDAPQPEMADEPGSPSPETSVPVDRDVSGRRLTIILEAVIIASLICVGIIFFISPLWRL